jgi:hypothetical protein
MVLSTLPGARTGLSVPHARLNQRGDADAAVFRALMRDLRLQYAEVGIVEKIFRGCVEGLTQYVPNRGINDLA